MLLKLTKHRHQLRHFLGGFCWRQQEEDRVEIALLRHDAVLTQVMRKDRRRNTELGVFPGLCINTRRGQQQLTGIDEVLILRVAFKAVPTCAWRKAKKATFTGDGFSWMILPRATVDDRRDKRLDHLAVRHDRFARLNAQLDALRPQAAAALPFVNFGVHIQCRKQRVERAG